MQKSLSEEVGSVGPRRFPYFFFFFSFYRIPGLSIILSTHKSPWIPFFLQLIPFQISISFLSVSHWALLSRAHNYTNNHKVFFRRPTFKEWENFKTSPFPFFFLSFPSRSRKGRAFLQFVKIIFMCEFKF